MQVSPACGRREAGWRSTLVAIAVAITAGFFLIAVSTPTQSARAYSDGWVDTDVLNLRDGAGTWAAVIDRMWQGEYVGVLDGPTDDGWYLVDYAGTVGWAYGGYLAVNGQRGWASDIGGGPVYVPDRWIDVNRSTQTVTLYEDDVAIASYWGAFGYDDSSSGFYATAVGTYYVYAKNAGLTWTDWGQAYIKYWVAFDPSRYNGFHSYSMDAYGNVLPNGDGPTGGCVALAPWAAAIVYDFAGIGTRVEVHW